MPTVWPRRLQLLTFACSAVFTVGTVLHGWVVIDEETLRLMPPARSA